MAEMDDIQTPPATPQRHKPAKRHVRSRPAHTELPLDLSPSPDLGGHGTALRYIDLFAGCGGLSTGLHLAGLKGLFAIERNEMAFSTLKANLIDGRKHFDWPADLPTRNWDIIDLLAQKAEFLAGLEGTVDLVVGGPPCQGFSTAGRRIEGDERNNLVHSYLRLVELVRPRAIFLENVRVSV